MATEAAAPSAQVVGNAFVEQYYQILHKSPEAVHRFYKDSSVLSRPEPNGLVTTVTTMQGINEKICSFDYKKYAAEIKTADAQDSHKDGVIVLVTGSLTGPDNVRKNFTQTFFLAPQERGGYFVLNDVFRYVEDNVVPVENSKVSLNETRDSAFAPPSPKPEPAQVVDLPIVDTSTSHIKVENVENIAHDELSNERELVSEKEEVAASDPQTIRNHVSEVTESATPIGESDAPKKSYASILSSQAKKGVVGTTKVYVPTNTAKIPPKKVENKAVAPVANTGTLAPGASASASAVESGKIQEVAVGYSIYIQNLPYNVMASEVEEEFEKFGPIKKGGVQVRNNKIHGSCFGFVEFESLSSMNDAIKASPVTIKGWKAIVEMKRTATRVGNGGGRFFSGRGGYRNDNYRGRENYGNGRGYGRNEYTNRGNFSGRGTGPSGRGGQVYQQGRGQGGSYRIADST